MTKHHFLYPILIGVIALFGAFWIKDAIAHARAEAVEQAQKQIQTAAQKRIDEREKQFDVERKQLLDKIKTIKTPQQAIKAIPGVIDLPAPITLPDAPQGSSEPVKAASLPIEDIKPLFDRLATCKLTENGLTKCDQDKKDLHIQLDSANVEAHQWKMAAKDGSKFHRFGKALKCLGFSAGGAALGSFSQNKAAGAAIGSAIGGGLCSIF